MFSPSPITQLVDLSMKISEIKDLITKARLEKALDEALTLAKTIDDDDIVSTLTLFQSQYHGNERDNNLGMKTSGQYSQARNRITHGLLKLLGDMEEDYPQLGDGGSGSAVSAAGQTNKPASSGTTSTPPPKPVAVDDVTQILFMASNPSDTGKLQLETEHSRVTRQLQNAPQPEKFPLQLKLAVTPSEFTQYLYLVKPDIVHFSGHGDRQAPDVQAVVTNRAGREESDDPDQQPQNDESGIFLYDEDKRNAHFVSSIFLKRTFKSMVKRNNIPIKAVIFNACHSEQQARAISEVVPYVIGTSWSVKDDAAVAFATGFYFGIAQGMSIESAVDNGINNALAYNEPEDRFILYKDGVKVEW